MCLIGTEKTDKKTQCKSTWQYHILHMHCLDYNGCIFLWCYFSIECTDISHCCFASIANSADQRLAQIWCCCSTVNLQHVNTATNYCYLLIIYTEAFAIWSNDGKFCVNVKLLYFAYQLHFLMFSQQYWAKSSASLNVTQHAAYNTHT